MISRIYIEEEIRDHERTKEILNRFAKIEQIICSHHSEVFNPSAQSFRLQKQNPALILAKKINRFVHQAPDAYRIGPYHNYYFSHMMNCIYDCRYCFLQGMYRSAHYVLFVNYEDFFEQIKNVAAQHNGDVAFFSGYDCDSLALEPVTHFAKFFTPAVMSLPNALLELRTKSTQIRHLLDIPANPRCIVAFSISPEEVVKKTEFKTPSLKKRIDAISKLQAQGWSIGLRFDPIIYFDGYENVYKKMFEQIFSQINTESLHSVSLGVFRMPDKFFKSLIKMHPQEKLFSAPFESSKGMTSYKHDLENEIISYCEQKLLRYIPAQKYFRCINA